MKNLKRLTSILILLLTILFAGCNFPLFNKEESVNNDEEIKLLATTVAQTLTAFQLQLQETADAALQLPTPTTLPVPGAGVATQAPLPTTGASSSGYGSPNCLIAGSVSETVPDNTAFAPGDPFNKTWTVINSGTCAWTTGFQYVFQSGDQMGGISPTYLSSAVPAGNIIDIPLSLTAQKTPGTYRGDWALQDENGTPFGYFWVKIVVEDVGAFAVTGATMSGPANHSGSCSYTYEYSANITANTFGTITYYFEYEDSSKTSKKSLEFAHSGTQTVSESRELSATGNYSVKLYVDSPNHQYFSPLDFYLSCK
jgi:hypothetical protein